MSDPIEFERDGKRWYLECKSESRHGLSVARATEFDLRAAGYVPRSDLTAALARVTELEGELETTVNTDAALAELDEQRAKFEEQLRAVTAERDNARDVADKYGLALTSANTELFLLRLLEQEVRTQKAHELTPKEQGELWNLDAYREEKAELTPMTNTQETDTLRRELEKLQLEPDSISRAARIARLQARIEALRSTKDSPGDTAQEVDGPYCNRCGLHKTDSIHISTKSHHFEPIRDPMAAGEEKRRPECPHGVGLCTASCPSKIPTPASSAVCPQCHSDRVIPSGFMCCNPWHDKPAESGEEASRVIAYHHSGTAASVRAPKPGDEWAHGPAEPTAGATITRAEEPAEYDPLEEAHRRILDLADDGSGTLRDIAGLLCDAIRERCDPPSSVGFITRAELRRVIEAGLQLVRPRATGGSTSAFVALREMLEALNQ